MNPSLFLLVILITIVTSTTPVPGHIYVQLLPDNQVANATYKALDIVHYVVRFDGVPIDDNVQFGVEIRGSNPTGGPRGYIATARDTTSIKRFIGEAHNRAQFRLAPAQVFAGYVWFLRPFVYFANEPIVSTNMMNSGASQSFTVLKI